MTAFYVFNIGKPPITAWWRQNLERGVITAGFDSEPGDRGETILRRMSEGDGVIAYCNRHGFVGFGIVGAEETYKLHPSLPADSLSNHQHERAVEWRYFVDDVGQAVTLDEVGRNAPRQTAERETEAFAMKVIGLLQARPATPPSSAKYWRVLEAVRGIGRSCSIREITEWLRSAYPNENVSDVRDNACVLTVNDANRRHHDRGRKSFRTDGGNPKDALFREGRYQQVMYTLYRPIVHGVWDLQPDAQGVLQATLLQVSALQTALAEAHHQIAAESLDPIATDEDARVRELRAVVLREGQGAFRDALLCAYGRRCAVTGCAVVEILEAAHIRPYLGPDTNRTDNGLLLRADIHTLFDKGLLWLDEGLVIRVDDLLLRSEYAPLAGTRLRLPDDPVHRPHLAHVAHHRAAVRS